jgi:hypothetical protein
MAVIGKSPCPEPRNAARAALEPPPRHAVWLAIRASTRCTGHDSACAAKTWCRSPGRSPERRTTPSRSSRARSLQPPSGGLDGILRRPSGCAILRGSRRKAPGGRATAGAAVLRHPPGLGNGLLIPLGPRSPWALFFFRRPGRKRPERRADRRDDHAASDEARETALALALWLDGG